MYVFRRTGHASQTLVVLHLRAQGLEEGDEHPPMLSCGALLTLPFTLPQKSHFIYLFIMNDRTIRTLCKKKVQIK